MMNIQLLIAALRARQRVFYYVLGTTFLVAALVTLLMPRTYVATASLLVDRKDAQSMTPDGSAPPERERTGYMQTQLDIITSHKVARRVAHDLRLGETAETRARFESDTDGKGTIDDWLADQLLKQVKVDLSQSSVVQVMASSADPLLSERIANAFAKAYIDTVLDLRTGPNRQAAVWFDDQLKTLRNNVEQAQLRLSDYEQANGIVAADERFDLESVRLGDLSNMLVKAQEQTFDATSKQQQAHKFLGESASAENLPEIIANPFIQTLKTDLLRGEARLDDLSTQYGVRHPMYQQQASQNQSLREKIRNEIRKIVDGLDNSAVQAKQREQSLAAALAAQRERVMGLKRQRNQAAVLVRDVDTAQRTYDTAMQRFMASKVESQARATNVALLSAAVAPLVPARPKVGLNLGLALVVGMLLGLAAVYFMEMADRRVRGLADLESELEVPLLAELDTWYPARERLLTMGASRALPGPG